MSSVASHAFGRFELLPARRKLLVDGRAIAIGGRAFDLLLTLIEHRDRVLTTAELLDKIWPDTAVDPNNISVHISTLRKLLGPDAIATVPGRGYRFCLAMDSEAEPASVAAPPAAEAAHRKTNLPESPGAMRGRIDDLAALGDLLDRHSLVTIIGAGGMGKSLLAQHLLHQRRDTYPHGVCWVDIGSVAVPSALPDAVASAIGVKLGGGAAVAALKSTLASLGMLIALDNAEHLIDAVSSLATALNDGAPMLRLLVTSQAPLHVAREQVYRLGGLAVPPGATAADEALRYGAVSLFVDRAQAADARFAIDDTTAADIIDVCRRLDGLPLAIELAAARAPMMGVRRVAEALGEPLQLLVKGRRDAPTRQQTLRAALGWSHGLLTLQEKKVFRRMAVVAGSASLELIQRIAADDAPAEDADPNQLDRWGVVDAMSGLIDRSLLAIDLTGDGERPRYRLLDSPRAYAQERLHEAGEADSLAERHARSFGQRLEAAWEERWDGRLGVDQWRRSVEPDRQNARVALAWAISACDLALVFQIAPVMLTRGALGEGSTSEQAALAEKLEECLAESPPAVAQLRTRVALAIRCREDPARCLPRARSAIGMARDAGDRFLLYVLLSLVARSAVRIGEEKLAADSYAEARSLEDAGWPPVRRYWGAETEAQFATVRQDSDVARLPLWRKALELLRAAGDSAHEAQSNLVDAELAAGEVEAAVASGRALVDMLQQTRDELTLAAARANLLAALLAQGDLGAAGPVAEAGWAIARGVDAQTYYADYLALLAALEGRWTTSARLAGYAAATYTRQGKPRWPNEARAFDRAMTLSRTALGSDELDRLMADGANLQDQDIAHVAFGHASVTRTGSRAGR